MKTDRIKSLTEIGNLGDKRIILRLDLNVPCSGGKVVDDYRIRRVLPTLGYISQSGARAVIISHIEGGSVSLKPVVNYLKGKFSIIYAKNLSEAIEMFPKIERGGFLMLENIRNEAGEQKNDQTLAKKIAGLGDIYVNEAFPVSHREHASVVSVPKYVPGYAGMTFLEEIKKLSQAFNPPKPSLFILGGAKFETKLPLVNKFLELYDYIFIGGALANDIFKAQGLSVGISDVSDKKLNLEKIIGSEKLYLPFDVVVKISTGSAVKRFNDVSGKDKIVDSGPSTSDELKRLLVKSKFVLWNGPLGQYEFGFADRTDDLAKLIASSGIESIIGGGDTVAAAEKTGLLEKFSFVSTGGGAMLEFLATGTLVGIEALKESK